MRSSLNSYRSDASGSRFAVEDRGAQYSLEGEVQRLRNRVSELEAENRLTKDELQRARTLVDHERESGLHYVQEMDMMQRKYSDHISELQHLLEQNEGLRRDTEVHLQSEVRKGEEFIDMFRSGKEQIEAREQYFAEMRMHFEQQVSELANQMQAEREGRVRAERSRQLAEQALEKLMNELDRMRAAEKTRSEMEDKFRQQMMTSNQRLHEIRTHEDKMRVLSVQNLENLKQWHDKYFSAALQEATDEDADQFFLA